MDRDDVRRLARRNHSLAARHFLTSSNADRMVWKRMLRSAEWEQLTPRVLRLTGAADTVEQHVAAAVLDAGAGSALYGRSAAAQWGIAGYVHSKRHRIEVIRPAGAKRIDAELAIVHTTIRPVDQQVRRLRDITVVSPAQTLLDLARELSESRLEAAVERALQRRIVSTSQLHDAISTVARSGRDGVQKMRDLLDARPPGAIPTESNLESRFLFLTTRAGITGFLRQVDVGDSSWIGRSDFVHQRVPLVVEVQSEAYHEALVDKVADGERRERLERAGYRVEEIWDTDLWYSADDVVARIRRAIAELDRPAA